MVRRAPPPEPPRLERGTRIGRYEIMELLGAGGMGVVYRAHDAELERDVALKVVTTDAIEDESHGRARLLREAQALAQLAHPHVTAIYDVGRVDGGVFLAMELVEGERLDAWMKVARHPWRQVLEVFRDAGRGLEAAHAAGLVHRDFKPSNVMLGADGRVRVLDFGLARAASAPPSVERTTSVPVGTPVGTEVELDDGQRSSSGSLLESSVTQIGSVVGTPAYMAPEQHLGVVGDARTDQFSFCVSFYEALYGERPFSARTREQLREAIVAGQVRPPPAGAKVPGWVRQILLRGLAAYPEARWPSMSALLAALERDPARRWRRIGALAGATALVALAGFGLWRGGHVARPCRGAEAQLHGVWDAARKQAVREVFLASGKPYAADAFRAVERALDGYALGWTSMNIETCEATQVRRVQSAELLDLRMQCLTERLDELRAQVEVFSGADATVIERATQAVHALPPLSQCADAAALRAPVRPPADLATRARVSELRKQLASARALLESGRYPEGLALASQLAVQARTLGYRPVEAEALYYLGRLQEVSGDYAGAVKSLRDAGVAAEAGRHDQFAARAWIWLVWVTGPRLGKYPEAHELAREAQAKLERFGHDDLLLAELDRHIGQLYADEGKYPEALDYAQRTLALRQKALPADDASIAVALSDVADVLAQQGKYDEAIVQYRRALASMVQAVGPEHPMVVSTLTNLAQSLRGKGQYAEAILAFDNAQRIAEKVYGPEHSSLATIFLDRGGVERSQRQYDAALGHYQRALAIWEKTFGPEHPNVGTVHYYIGSVALEQGRVAEALVELERTLAIWEKALGPEHPSLSAALAGIGNARYAQGDARGALASYERAVSLLEKAQGLDHPDLAESLTGMGLAWLALGEPRRGLPPLERALEIRLANPGDPLELARTQFALSRTLAATGGDRKRARELATQARAAYAAHPGAKRETAEIDAWLGKSR